MDEIRRLSQGSAPPVLPNGQQLPAAALKDNDSGLLRVDSIAPESPADSITPVEIRKPQASVHPQASSGGVNLQTKVVASLAAFGMVLAAAVAVIAIRHKNSQSKQISAAAAAAAITPTPVASPTPAAAPAPRVEPTAPSKVEAEEAETDESEAEAEAGEEGEEVAAEEQAPAAEARANALSTKKARRKARPGNKPRAKAKAVARAKPKKKPSVDDILGGTKSRKKSKPSKGSPSIDDLLSGAVGGKSAPKAKTAAKPAPAKKDLAGPTRDQTKAALGKVGAAVKRCNGSGVAMAAITVSGSTGKVTSVNVTGAEGAVGTCVAKAVKRARFPKFERPQFKVKFPFRM